MTATITKHTPTLTLIRMHGAMKVKSMGRNGYDRRKVAIEFSYRRGPCEGCGRAVADTMDDARDFYRAAQAAIREGHLKWVTMVVVVDAGDVVWSGAVSKDR